MIPSAKGAIALAIAGGLIAILKLVVQARSARQAAADKLLADAEVARLRREAEERLARHTREAEERAEEATERKAEREQRDKLLAELQAANAATLDFMKSQLQAQQVAGAQRYAIIERNTAANEKLAAACATQASELRVMVDRVGRLEGGAGCRAPGARA
ncbi:MAG: hypothetical protein PHS14_02940 [Elusimicrobia bacterium]|nr:hypothetical protein [Elusimicrobiota bacterium]